MKLFVTSDHSAAHMQVMNVRLSWDIPFLVSHIRDNHKVDMQIGCTFNHRYVKSNPLEVDNATWILTLSNYRFHVLSGLIGGIS